jgi:hypothetical protein
VARSATGFEAAMNVGSIHDGESISVILAESLLDLRIIEIEVYAVVIGII